MAAEGAEIVLSDGIVRRLRFTNRALVRVEETVGSVGAVIDMLTLNDYSGPQLTPLVHTIVASLADKERLSFGQVLDLIDLEKIVAYKDAIDTALAQAFPKKDDVEEGKAPEPTSEENSPGKTSTPSESERSGELVKSSGA